VNFVHSHPPTASLRSWKSITVFVGVVALVPRPNNGDGQLK
jgi:hypothetical protein